MKRIFIYTIIISLIATLSGCSQNNNQPLNTEKTKTVVELDGKYNYQVYTVLVDDVFVTYANLKAGTEVFVVNEDSRFYYIDLNGLTVAVDKDAIDMVEQQFKGNSNDPVSATLIDDVDAIMAIVNRDDTVKVLSIEGDKATIVYNGTVSNVPSEVIRGTDESTLAWDGFANTNAVIYSDYACTEVLEKLSINTKVHIIDQVGDVYVVELEDGEIGYMPVSKISDVPNKVTQKPVVKPVVEDTTGNSSGGGSQQGPSTPNSSDSSNNDGESGSLNGASGNENSGDGESGSLNGGGPAPSVPSEPSGDESFMVE